MEQFSICLAEEKDVDDIYRLMCEAKAGLSNPDYYEADDREYVRRHIREEGFTLIAKADEVPAGFLMIRYPGLNEDNLLMDMIDKADAEKPEEQLLKALHFESAAVLSSFRGHGIQKKLMLEALELLKSTNYLYYLATVHPDNAASLISLKQCGFKVVGRLTKYGGMDRLLLYRDK